MYSNSTNKVIVFLIRENLLFTSRMVKLEMHDVDT